jgi:hypothetical protein
MHFGRRSVAETAEMLGITTAMVTLRSYHGIRQLRDAIGS